MANIYHKRYLQIEMQYKSGIEASRGYQEIMPLYPVQRTQRIGIKVQVQDQHNDIPLLRTKQPLYHPPRPRRRLSVRMATIPCINSDNRLSLPHNQRRGPNSVAIQIEAVFDVATSAKVVVVLQIGIIGSIVHVAFAARLALVPLTVYSSRDKERAFAVGCGLRRRCLRSLMRDVLILGRGFGRLSSRRDSVRLL
jgi:hypothetical protein